MRQVVMTIAFLALISCGSTPAGLAADGTGTVTLAPGETARTAEGRVPVRFDDVVTDSRCPTGEQCITAGFAEVVLTAGEGTEAAEYHLFTEGREPRAFTHAGHTVTLVSLAPHPKGSSTIPKAEYRATLEVQRQ